MDLKDLNNYQLILLVLLISFVTSIATGIITVTLLQQAPPQVTGVINHVIEKTIQQVTPSTTGKNQTIIIKEDDLVAEALSEGFQQVGELYTVSNTQSQVPAETPVADASSSLAASAALAQTPPTTAPVASFASLGALVDTSGTFLVPLSYTVAPGDYVKINGGKYNVLSSAYDEKSDLTVLKLSPQKDSKSFADLAPGGIADMAKVGQTALLVGRNGAFLKTVVSAITLSGNDSVSGSYLEFQDTVPGAFQGAPVLSLDGKIIGVVIETALDAKGDSEVVASDVIQNALKAANSQK